MSTTTIYHFVYLCVTETLKGKLHVADQQIENIWAELNRLSSTTTQQNYDVATLMADYNQTL